MRLYRTILSVLVTVAIVVAPAASAWVGGTMGMGMSMSHAVPHAEAGLDSQGAAPMEDCASMMKAAGTSSDCPCCDKDKACQPQFCMAKCFQLLGLVQQSRPVARLVTTVPRPTTPAHPPDWSDQPQPPPPRT